MIKKKVILDSAGHYRYYSALYNPELGKLKGHERPKCPIIDLELFPKLQTEKQLIRGLYDSYGDGEYLIFGFIKGKKGTWVFGKWNVTEEGFCREKRITNYKRAINKLKDELSLAEDQDEEDLIKDEMDVEKEYKIESDYGFAGHLKSSSRIGTFVFWDDDEIELPNEKFDEWADNAVKDEPEDAWGANISRAKDKAEKFEEW